MYDPPKTFCTLLSPSLFLYIVYLFPLVPFLIILSAFGVRGPETIPTQEVLLSPMT